MKKMMRIISVALAAILLLASLTACGGSGGGQGSAGGGSAAGSGYVDTGEYTGPAMELVFSFSSAESSMAVYTQALENITKRTGGKVTFVNYYGGSLVNATGSLDALSSGMCDLAEVSLANFKDRFPYTEQVIGYPFLGFTQFAMTADVLRDFIPNNETCMAEFEAQNIKPFFFMGTWGTSIVLREDKDILVPEDLAGMKVLATSNVENKFIQACGATPVDQPLTEAYSCMQSGVVDAIMAGLYLTNIFGALQLSKHAYMLERSFATGCSTFSINLDVWNSFNDELKTIFMEEWTNDDFFASCAESWAVKDQKHLDDCEEWGIPVTYITGDQMTPWIEKAQPLGDESLQQLYDEGYTEVFNVLEDLNKAIEAYDGNYK